MRRISHFRCRSNADAWIASFWLLVLVAGALSGLFGAAQAAGKESPGYAVFVAKGCFECHGYLGQGSIYTGPAIAPNPISLDAMRAYVRAPSGQMPPYSSSILTDSELAQIHDYLSSVPAPRPPDKIRLLPQIPASARQTDGVRPAEPAASGNVSALYAANCASCHGAAGEGGVGPSLRAESSKRELAQTVELISAPRPPMPKLYPAVLSRTQVEDLAQYIRSLR